MPASKRGDWLPGVTGFSCLQNRRRLCDDRRHAWPAMAQNTRRGFPGACAGTAFGDAAGCTRNLFAAHRWPQSQAPIDRRLQPD
jgi:hypothetical protein